MLLNLTQPFFRLIPSADIFCLRAQVVAAFYSTLKTSVCQISLLQKTPISYQFFAVWQRENGVLWKAKVAIFPPPEEKRFQAGERGISVGYKPEIMRLRCLLKPFEANPDDTVVFFLPHILPVTGKPLW